VAEEGFDGVDFVHSGAAITSMTIDWKRKDKRVAAALIAVSIFILFKLLDFFGTCSFLGKVHIHLWGHDTCWKTVYVCAVAGHWCHERQWKSSEELDRDAAIPQLRSRAENGDVVAQFQLGKYYEEAAYEALNRRSLFNNEGKWNAEATAQKEADNKGESALIWYRIAAEQGNREAQKSLGWMYAIGNWVPNNYQDYSDAYFWLKLSELDNKKALEVAGRLTAQQKAKADKRLKEWKPVPQPKRLDEFEDMEPKEFENILGNKP
jgi:TPR repeat protein